MNVHRIARKVREHIWGPVGSMLFHSAILLALLAWARHVPPAASPPLPPVTINQAAITDLVLDGPIPAPDRERLIVPDAPVAPDTDPPGDTVGAADPAAGVSTPENLGALPPMEVTRSPLVQNWVMNDIPGFLGNERTKRIGDIVGTQNGTARVPGKPSSKMAEAETAIQKALAWLKAHQDEDGSWGPNRIGMTGLALLTFFGHGEDTRSRLYGQVVSRAVDYLIAHQQSDGLFAMSSKASQPTVYEHAIATYAISEAYGMTRNPALREPMEKAAAVIVQGQQPGGLWDYEFKKAARWDTSVSGWQIQALKAAFVNKAQTPGLVEAIAKSASGLKAAQDSGTGRFGYTEPGKGNASMTAVGALCLELSDRLHEPQTRAGLRELKDAGCDWMQPSAWPMYTWYYVTQALYHDHGAAWESWHRKLIGELTRNQSRDGSWSSPAGSKAENEETRHGLVYSTALAVLALEAPYRYAPVSQAMHGQKLQQKQKPDEEIIVEVI